MKFVIASDIHGSALWCRKLCEKIDREQPDRILLLGDLLYHGPRNHLPDDYSPRDVISMLSGYKDVILAVRGNCDAEVDQMVLPFSILNESTQIFADGTLFYMTHGHHQNPENLPLLPDNTIFLFGHTHVKMDRTIQQVRCINPGSVSIPKDGSHTCVVYNNGAISFSVLG